MEHLSCDVLVIGGGGAALRAALAARNAGASVAIVLKKRLGASGATAYQVSEMAGYNVPDGAKDPADCPEAYHSDIMSAGAGMADSALARVIAEQAQSTLEQLEAWGVPFKRDADGYFAFHSCFSTRRRTHVIPGHGEPIIQAMLAQLAERPVTVLEDSMVLSLMVRDNACHGAWVLTDDGEIAEVRAGAVIMATGGAGRAFSNNMNPADITGDGYALGYRAGAKLINMEFMQAGIGIIHPVISLINAYIWGGLPRVLDRNGRDAVKLVTPDPLSTTDVLMMHRRHFPFSSSDTSKYLELGIQEAVLNGNGTDHGGVFCDFRHMTDDYVGQCANDYGIREMWPLARDFFEKRGARILDEVVEIACFAHAINGGLLIDPDARTSIDGLFAAGETAGGPHGADRLGGNMMVTCQVFGRIAGESAARYALGHARQAGLDAAADRQLERVRQILYKQADTEGMIQRLQSANQRLLLVRRSGAGLQQLLDTIRDLERDLDAAPDGQTASARNVELANLLETSRIMAEAALARCESRGSHYRVDFQTTDDSLARPNIIQLGSK